MESDFRDITKYHSMRVGQFGVVTVSPALMLILVAGVANGVPASSDALPNAAPPQMPTEGVDAACRSQDPRNIVVCAQRRQPYRVDPNVMEAGAQAKSNSRSATSATPAAQAACSSSPMGCTKDLKSLDLANVAIVVGTTAVRAAKGEGWAKAFRPAGADEYQLYQQGKQRREAQAEERAAAEMKRRAEEQDRNGHVREVDSN